MKQLIIKSGITEKQLKSFISTWGDLWDIEIFSLAENVEFINQLI